MSMITEKVALKIYWESDKKLIDSNKLDFFPGLRII